MKCVYLTYDGLLDPLGQSQVLPYVTCLLRDGHSFTIVSYEKSKRSPREIKALEKKLALAGVKWVRLPFKATKLGLVRRIIAGIMTVRRVCRRERPDLVHLRGLMPAIIYKLSFVRVRHLYDFRSFAIEEWTDFGKLRPNSMLYRLLRWIDHRAIKTACGIVVLERSAEALLRQTYEVPDVPLAVIRTCTDVSRYLGARKDDRGSRIRFAFLGGAKRPYRPDLALRLVEQLLAHGIESELDFLNENDHAEIQAAIDSSNIPRNRVSLLKATQAEVPTMLDRYNCGLIFYDSSQWRRVCSPTKLGEYLAAGLRVISTEGVDVLEELAAVSSCIKIVPREQLAGCMSVETANRVVAFIRRPGAEAECRELARREFSLEMAGALFSGLYRRIEERQ